jgi:parallel beta-helix repeat protein
MIPLLGLSLVSTCKGVDNRLVAYWSFDEGSGTTASDSSGNGNTGALHGGATWTDGKSAKALDFNGVDGYVQIPQSSSLDVTAQVTVETWVYLRAYVDSTGMNSHLVSRSDSSGGPLYVLATFANGKINYDAGPFSGYHSSVATLPLNSWTHLAMTYNGASVCLYINGVLDSNYAQSGSIPTTSNWLAIGCKPTAPSGGPGTYAYTNGTIDEVRIYNRALTQQEIRTVMDLPTSPNNRYAWPMFHQNLKHAGFTESPAPNTNQSLWNYTTGSYVESSPAVADGRVYVGSDDGRVYCLDAANGAQVWNYTTGFWVRSSPAVADGRVYMGSLDCRVYCLDASTGAQVWNYTTGGYVYSSPAVVDGRVYVGSDDGRVYCLDAAAGTEVWNYTTGNTVVSPPAVVDGRVYVGSDDGRVYCLDAAAGTEVWNYTTGNSVHSSPAVADGRVYVGSDDGRVYCLDAANGAQVWNYTTGNVVYSSPAVVAGRVCVGSDDGRVYCLDASTGAQVWNYTTGNTVESSPAVADGKVYVGSLDCRVYCLDAANGAQVWNYTTGGYVYSSPAVAEGVVYVGSNDSNVYAFGKVVRTEDYASVQAAVDAATAGATVWVAPGTYSESLIVNKTIAIIGEKGCDPIFGGGGSGIAITLLKGASGSTVTGIVCTAWDQGVLIQNSVDCKIYGNSICLMGSSAIVLEGSSGNVISENTISQNAGGINLTGSDNNRIFHNNFVGNTVQLSVQSSTGNLWDDGYPSGGNYWSNHTGLDLYSGPNQDQPGSDGIVDTGYTVATGNVDRYPLVHGVHEIGIVHAAVSKTVVGRGCSLSVELEISDYGFYDEDFTVTVYTNTSIAVTRNIAVAAGEAVNVTLTLDTTYCAYGNYTVNVYAWPVLDEANVLDNNFTGGWVVVAGVGDLTGGTPNALDFVPDGKVQIVDIAVVARYFGQKVPPAPPNCDVSGTTIGVPDGKIDITDVATVAKHFGEHYP